MKNNIFGTKNTNTPSTLSAGIMAVFGEADGAQRKVVTQDEVPLRGALTVFVLQLFGLKLQGQTFSEVDSVSVQLLSFD